MEVEILNAILERLNSIEGYLSNYLFNFTHTLIAYMLIAVIVLLVGFAIIYFLFKLFGVG